MTTQVYRHKIRAISDAMIIRGIESGIEKDEIGLLRKIYTYQETDNYIENYIKWFWRYKKGAFKSYGRKYN